MGGSINNRLACFHRLPEGAGGLTDIGSKDLMAGPSAGIVAPYAGYPFGRTIKRYNTPVKVNGKNPFID
jgi:hypothetical protein